MALIGQPPVGVHTPPPLGALIARLQNAPMRAMTNRITPHIPAPIARAGTEPQAPGLRGIGIGASYPPLPHEQIDGGTALGRLQDLLLRMHTGEIGGADGGAGFPGDMVPAQEEPFQFAALNALRGGGPMRRPASVRPLARMAAGY